MKKHGWNLALILFIAFQLILVGRMVYTHSFTRQLGTEYRFLCEAYDPVHPFAGRYMQLNLQNVSVPSKFKNPGMMPENGYLVFADTKDSFAKPLYITDTEPTFSNNYLQVSSFNVNQNSENKNQYFVEYPFDRFYLAENDAPKAEKLVNQNLRDSGSRVWIAVSIYKGKYVVNNLFINNNTLKSALDE